MRYDELRDDSAQWQEIEEAQRRSRGAGRWVAVSRVRRGDVWLVDFGEPIGRQQSGRRPAVVVSADALNDSRAGLVIVVPCTTAQRAALPRRTRSRRVRTRDEISYAKCEDIKSISEERLVARLGETPLDAMFAIARAVRFLLDL
ncbi:MAG: type II toxin-antitoxin system PemK/MazF family toxin [Acidimicrobiales bacterium]